MQGGERCSNRTPDANSRGHKLPADTVNPFRTPPIPHCASCPSIGTSAKSRGNCSSLSRRLTSAVGDSKSRLDRCSGDKMADSISVLFVCLGNVCRSTMAEGVFQSMVDKPPYKGLVSKIDSCGTGNYVAIFELAVAAG
jgi:Low molecular weight phosphotyrosine protein phosphatase